MREETLRIRMAAGDKDAMEQLVRKYYPDILRYCIWHAPDRHQAEDAVQETFMKAIRYASACGFSGNFKSFLYKIAANTCIDLKRQRWNSLKYMDELDEEVPIVEKGFEQAEENELLRRVVKNLPEDEREIVLLRIGQELKLREIAEIMDLPMRTVQSKWKAALKKIKRDWR